MGKELVPILKTAQENQEHARHINAVPREMATHGNIAEIHEIHSVPHESATHGNIAERAIITQKPLKEAAKEAEDLITSNGLNEDEQKKKEEKGDKKDKKEKKEKKHKKSVANEQVAVDIAEGSAIVDDTKDSISKGGAEKHETFYAEKTSEKERIEEIEKQRAEEIEKQRLEEIERKRLE